MAGASLSLFPLEGSVLGIVIGPVLPAVSVGEGQRVRFLGGTAVEEEPQVVHKGWVPRPRVRKAGRRNSRLGRAFASVTSLLCK